MERGEYEVVEDLCLKGLKIIRNTRGFTYGTDAVLLANFAHAKPDEKLLDLGAGTGILAILVNGKTGAHVTAVEIDEAMCDMARRSVELNGQGAYIRVLCSDLRTLKTELPAGGFDAAVCNPPYFAGGTKSENNRRRVSTHQDECTVYDVALCAKQLLKNGGRLYLAYPAPLFAQACHALTQNRLEIKRAQMVLSRRGASPHIMLLEARKAARPGIVWETPLVLNSGGGAEPITL